MSDKTPATCVEDINNLPEVSGYIFTHTDCPSCSMENIFEGDPRDEVLECETCGTKFVIT